MASPGVAASSPMKVYPGQWSVISRASRSATPAGEEDGVLPVMACRRVCNGEAAVVQATDGVSGRVTDRADGLWLRSKPSDDDAGAEWGSVDSSGVALKSATTCGAAERWTVEGEVGERGVIDMRECSDEDPSPLRQLHLLFIRLLSDEEIHGALRGDVPMLENRNRSPPRSNDRSHYGRECDLRVWWIPGRRQLQVPTDDNYIAPSGFSSSALTS